MFFKERKGRAEEMLGKGREGREGDVLCKEQEGLGRESVGEGEGKKGRLSIL